MSLPALYESDFLIDDGDGTVVHYRRHGSSPAAADFCDAAVPGVASWRAGRQAWAGAQHRKQSSAVPCYPATSPLLFEHRVGVVPDELLAVVDRLGWAPGLTGANRVHIGERYSEGERLVPRVERLFTRAAADMLAEHPFGYTVESPATLYLTHRRADGTGAYDAHIHQDDAYDPWRRWLSLVMYFTDPDEYEGGDLLITSIGERLRPGRGDVVLIRGDVEHQVEPITAGARTTLTVHAAEPRWWLDPRDEVEAADPDERCRVLDRLFTEGQVDTVALRRGLALAWASCHYPEEQLPVARWLALFRAAGYVSDHIGWRPTQPVGLFRSCDAGRERRLTWTANLSAAQWFKEKFDRAELWGATAPADAVLAWFGVDGGFEVVVDPDQLYDLERIE